MMLVFQVLKKLFLFIRVVVDFGCQLGLLLVVVLKLLLEFEVFLNDLFDLFLQLLVLLRYLLYLTVDYFLECVSGGSWLVCVED
jgi:hypothetical protein